MHRGSRSGQAVARAACGGEGSEQGPSKALGSGRIQRATGMEGAGHGSHRKMSTWPASVTGREIGGDSRGRQQTQQRLGVGADFGPDGPCVHVS